MPSSVPRHLWGESFAVLLGDDVVYNEPGRPALHQLIDVYEATGSSVLGCYVITPQIFSILENTLPGKGGEIQLTDALRVLAHREPVYAYDFEGIRYDVGNKLGFLKATVEYALRRPNLGILFHNYLQGLFKEEND